MDTKESFSCDICDSKYTALRSLQRHTNKHENIFYSCDICNKTFSRKDSLSKHLKISCNKLKSKVALNSEKTPEKSTNTTNPNPNQHNAENIEMFKNDLLIKKSKIGTEENAKKNAYPCSVCYDTFITSGELREHIDAQHPDLINNLSCLLCGLSFTRFNTLTQHMRMHLDIRIYSCQNCDQSFCNLKRKKSHLKKCLKLDLLKRKNNENDNGIMIPKNEENTEKMHVNSLNMKAKHNFPCNACLLTFESSAVLRCHILDLHPNVPYDIACSLCDQKFGRLYQLMEHTRKHLDIRPYSCDNCGEAFCTSKARHTHFFKYHQTESNEIHEEPISIEEKQSMLLKENILYLL